FCTRLAEGFRPFRRVPLFQPVVERLLESRVRLVAIGLGMELRCRRARNLDRIRIPFRVRRQGNGAVIIFLEGIRDAADMRRESRYRPDTPMDEDAELRLVIPL